MALAGLLAVAAAYALVWLVPLPERLQSAHSEALFYADGSVAHVFLSEDDKWRLPVQLNKVDPDYVDALVAYEDQRFWWHPGVDPVAIGRAALGNASSGRVVSGASTLTMQLVRLVEPRPRTLRSKLIECVRAVQLEQRMSKEEILAAYLSFTPYGRNVEGIESASVAFFDHRPDELTSAEIATLLAVPQSPTRRYPAPRNTDRLRAARDDIALRLQLEDVFETPVPARLRPAPRDAAHAATWLSGSSDLQRAQGRTTLDRGVQRLAERVLAGHRDEMYRKGVYNASIVIVEHESAHVRGVIGSFDFNDADHGGQIVGFDTPRSPGSALKPFVYAMALERGLLLPDHLVSDVPVRYGAYSPENYDGRFNGLVPMEEALSRSLNIPFVNLLSDVGVEPFIGNLRGMGFDDLDWDPGYYGLSAAVGGIEVTPMEMAGLYAALAQDGVYRPLQIVQESGSVEPRQSFAPGATYLTRRALSIRDRPDFPSRSALSSAPRHIHWKTGTSFGHRDAWAIGSGERYTVVVWLGNFDRQGSVHLIGAEAAGPILFDLLEGLDDGIDREPQPTADLIEVQVCSLSGHLPGPACAHTRSVLALERAVPAQTCALHRRIEVDEASGLAVGPGCRNGLQTRTESYVVWPTSVRRFLGDQHRAQRRSPRAHPACKVSTDSAPVVTSPGPGEVVLLIPGLEPKLQELALEGDSALADADLSWFVDGALIGRAGADERVWWTPTPGRHEVLVMDGAGRSGVRRFEVR